MSIPLLQDMAGHWSFLTFGNRDPKVTMKVIQREVQELAEAVESGVYDDQSFECADVFISLLVLCNELHIDLEQFTSYKLTKNMMRKWEKNPDGTFSHVSDEDNS